jgi:hypothetical protein
MAFLTSSETLKNSMNRVKPKEDLLSDKHLMINTRVIGQLLFAPKTAKMLMCPSKIVLTNMEKRCASTSLKKIADISFGKIHDLLNYYLYDFIDRD